MIKHIQRLGKALLLPIAVLPVCGIMMGLGYALCPATMQGGDIHGLIAMTGYFLVKAGGAVIDHIALIFAVGVATGLSDDNDGTSALSGLIAWLMMTTLLNSSTVTTMIPSVADDAVKVLAFSKIENAFIGILCGIIGSNAYNHFKGVRLPDYLAFFSGKRFVAIATAGISVVVSAILLIVWPLVFSGLIKLGQGIAGMGYVGAALYAFLNRLLIPTGLHHALNNVFWFDSVGIGDLTHFWAGHTSADVTWDLGIYMSGFFAPMMFGIPGAALAVIVNAKPEQRTKTIGIIGSAALCALLSGITEPFEFSFMFICFPLYVLYSALYGLFTFIACIAGFRAGFCFSGGITDLIFSSTLPAANNTLAILWMGPLAFVVFFLVFHFVIKTFNLTIVGADEEKESIDQSEVKSSDEKYADFAEAIIKGVGGIDNVAHVDHCATRLRFDLNDTSVADETALKKAGAIGVLKLGKNALQVVVGTNVPYVYEAVVALIDNEKRRD